MYCKNQVGLNRFGSQQPISACISTCGAEQSALMQDEILGAELNAMYEWMYVQYICMYIFMYVEGRRL